MPVNSCLLRWSEEEALNFPKRAMDLATCPACGFLWNTSFEEDIPLYNRDYESTQMYSGVFRDYVEGMAREWLSCQDHEPSSILEVGCGQGEFLAVLERLTSAHLVGFDPSFRNDTSGRAKIIAEYLPSTASAQFDLVINRMTLEHIARPQEFLANLSNWLASDGTLITQVPNAEHVVSGENVCELFYEHVNYFTPASLVSALENAGFAVNRPYISYGGQHLTVVSRRGNCNDKQARPPVHTEKSNLPKALIKFKTYWNEILNERAESGRKVWIWGTGSRATTFLSLLQSSDHICGAIDINPKREGSYILGTRCKTFMPISLAGQENLTIVVMNPIYRDEISACLLEVSAEAELLLAGSESHVQSRHPADRIADHVQAHRP
jgi:SAM-dependent methyltransferase